MPSERSDTRGIDVDHPAEEDEETAEDEEDSDLDEEQAEEESGGDAEAGGDEEVEEVEAEEVVPESRPRPKKAAAPARKASREPPEQEPRSGRRIWVVVLVLLIIVPAAGLIYFFYGPSGEIQAIDLIAQEYTDSNGVTGMSLVAQVNTGKPSHLSGDADMAIIYKGATTWTGKMGISESQGTKSIPLSLFAEGNGDYKVQVRFQGKSSSTTFTESHIIERLNVTAFNMTRMTNSTIDYGTARLGVRIIFLSNSSESQKAVTGDSLSIEITGGGGSNNYTENIANKVQLNLNYSVPGIESYNATRNTYTVKVTFQNSKVRPVSQLSTITTLGVDPKTNLTNIMVFVPPKAEAGPDQTVQWKLVDGGGKVTLDGSKSFGYGGARITNWTWDCGDDWIEDTEMATHTYKNPGNYLVKLLVVDNYGNTDIDTCTVVVN